MSSENYKVTSWMQTSLDFQNWQDLMAAWKLPQNNEDLFFRIFSFYVNYSAKDKDVQIAAYLLNEMR